MKRIKIFCGLIAILLIQPAFGSHKVVVIHGYGSSTLMMHKIDKYLKNAHFTTENYAYKSMADDLDSLGKQLYTNIKLLGVDTLSFVTHSMGALVFRSMLQYAKGDKSFPIIYRIVMIAPPNHGAEIADFYASFALMQKLLGPNIAHMKTDSGSYANKLPVPQHSEVGIIIGMRGKKHGYNPFISGDNDGLLTPQRTTLGIEKDVAILNLEHNVLTQNKTVCKLAVEFLKTGAFVSKTNQP